MAEQKDKVREEIAIWLANSDGCDWKCVSEDRRVFYREDADQIIALFEGVSSSIKSKEG